MSLQENVLLAPYTTIGLGGPARFFVTCTTVEEIKEAILHARDNKLPIHILGGGSNTIFEDSGFNGLVIQVRLTGREYVDQGDTVAATIAAGEEWDTFVLDTVTQGLGGVECLSGIPGLVGATPMQNVGAYGQEVAQTITHVRLLNVDTLEEVEFTNKECEFVYRSSRLKTDTNHRYVVLAVTFKLQKNAEPTIAYDQVKALYTERYPNQSETRGPKALMQVRELVLELRRKKSMVVSPEDPNSQSCGSFFVNPIVTGDVAAAIQEKTDKEIPTFPAGEDVKLSAAWLIEQAGFPRGFRRGGVGISANHTLALVNYGGTAVELLSLADEIKKQVNDMFDIQLEQEPVVISSPKPLQ